VKKNALVLFSGGLDSTAALHLALDTCSQVSAVGFDYGQPHRIELDYAARIAKRRCVRFTQLVLAESVRGLSTLSVPQPGANSSGVSRANMPGRNAIFLAIAAAHAARTWPGEEAILVIGCNADDADTFPDCRVHFIRALESALSAAMSSVIGLRVSAPWVENGMRKVDIVKWCRQRDDALVDIGDSISCYAGKNCMACDACMLRASAIAASAK